MKCTVLSAAFCAVALVVVVGCTSTYNPGYVQSDDVQFVSPRRLSASEKTMLVRKLCSALYVDPTFSGSYQRKVASFAKGKRLPVIAVEPFENNTADGRSDSAATRQLVLELMSELRKSGRFTVLNDTWTADSIQRMVDGNRRLGENDSALQGVGTFEPPDYLLGGDIFVEVDGNIYTHSLNAHIMDMANRQVFWSDTFRLVKSDGKPQL